MAPVLRAIQAHPNLQLQLIATGMHLDPKHGKSLALIRQEGWKVDRTIPWRPGASRVQVARATGEAVASLAMAFEAMKTDVVIVVGDRVEAFAAASAGAISGRTVAHVHGGDRALGQLDDLLRHAITKLAHVHFPATRSSAERLRRLGEDRWRIHMVGSPGIDGVTEAAAGRSVLRKRYGLSNELFALLLLHPTSADERLEEARAKQLVDASRSAGLRRVFIIGPNNDPGSGGILRAWSRVTREPEVVFQPDIPRSDFLGLLRDTGCLIGNSSSGIIEAASFGTPVLDVGDRQRGRERNRGVMHVPFDANAIRRAVKAIWRGGRPRRFARRNLYGRGRAGATIAAVLASIQAGEPTPKLITY